jgi:hypothetical protein
MIILPSDLQYWAQQVKPLGITITAFDISSGGTGYLIEGPRLRASFHKANAVDAFFTGFYAGYHHDKHVRQLEKIHRRY